MSSHTQKGRDMTVFKNTKNFMQHKNCTEKKMLFSQGTHIIKVFRKNQWTHTLKIKGTWCHLMTQKILAKIQNFAEM